MSSQVSVTFSFAAIGFSSFKHCTGFKGHSLCVVVKEAAIGTILCEERRKRLKVFGFLMVMPDPFLATQEVCVAYDFMDVLLLGSRQEFGAVAEGFCKYGVVPIRTILVAHQEMAVVTAAIGGMWGI